jgi:hypothetical protein
MDHGLTVFQTADGSSKQLRFFGQETRSRAAQADPKSTPYLVHETKRDFRQDNRQIKALA